jgi:ribose transport system substrate-binding protein
MLRYAEGSASTNEREDGFLEAVRAHRNIEVLSENQYGGADVEGAYKKSEAMLNRFRTPDGRLAVDGIFCPNESTTIGVLRALHDNGWEGKVRFVGFDASDTVIQGVRDGKVDGLVVQDPMRMGYLAVATLAAHTRGEKVERRIDTGARLITRNILDKPDIKELLNPDLTRWLKP